MSFGAEAARLAGLAGALLGWRAEDFWRATPAELATILAALTPGPAAPLPHEIDRLKDLFPDG